MQIFDLHTGKKIHDFNVGLGTIKAMSGERHHTEMFYSFSSFLTPNIIYKVDFKDGKITEKVNTAYCTIIGE